MVISTWIARNETLALVDQKRASFSKEGSMSRCDGKRGIFGRCTKEQTHPGDHDNGKSTWPRVGMDLEIYLRTLSYLEEMNAEERRLQGLAERHERGDL